MIYQFIQAVNEYYEIDVRKITRAHKYSVPRGIVCYCLLTLKLEKQKDIKHALNYKEHGSVLAGRKRTEDRMSYDEYFKAEVLELMNICKQIYFEKVNKRIINKRTNYAVKLLQSKGYKIDLVNDNWEKEKITVTYKQLIDLVDLCKTH